MIRITFTTASPPQQLKDEFHVQVCETTNCQIPFNEQISVPIYTEIVSRIPYGLKTMSLVIIYHATIHWDVLS